MRALVNDFAVRSFRDIADGDYVVARLAHRATLIPQFLWSSLQAVEKYLKAILLFNRVPHVKATHGVSLLLLKVESISKLRLRLSESTRDFVAYLDDYGRFRYLEVSYHARGAGLLQLDRAVWELRRYCTVLDYMGTNRDGSTVSMLENELKHLESFESCPRQFGLFRGELERIVSTRGHPARPGLIWNNMYFGRSRRKYVNIID